MGADNRDLQQSIGNQPNWKQLNFSYLPRIEAQTLAGSLTTHATLLNESKNVSASVFGMSPELKASNPVSDSKVSKVPSSTHDIELRMPSLGDSNEVQVIELLVKVGDKVKADQSIITVESDKASMEIPSLHNGVLKDLKVKLGDSVHEGSLIATIEISNFTEGLIEQWQRSSPTLAPKVLEVRIPEIGDFKDLVVIELLVKAGDLVKKEQSIITVESDKATMEIPSSESGVVRELKVRLGDKVNEGTLILLLDAPKSSIEHPANDVKCPPLSMYVPSTQKYSHLTLETELLELIRGIRSRSSHWHILVGGSKSVPKLLIRDLILRDLTFSSIRTTSGSVLQYPKDLAAILCGLEVTSLLELDGLEELFSPSNSTGDILYTVLPDLQLDIVIGEGVEARPIKLDLQPFCSIFYCKDVNKIPTTLLNLFDACISADD
jgi:biotin carboxyl carrier protein